MATRAYCEVEVMREFLPAQSLVQELRSLLGLELPQEGGEAFVFLELFPQVDVTRCVNTDPIRWRETGVDRALLDLLPEELTA